MSWMPILKSYSQISMTNALLRVIGSRLSLIPVAPYESLVNTRSITSKMPG